MLRCCFGHTQFATVWDQVLPFGRSCLSQFSCLTLKLGSFVCYTKSFSLAFSMVEAHCLMPIQNRQVLQGLSDFPIAFNNFCLPSTTSALLPLGWPPGGDVFSTGPPEGSTAAASYAVQGPGYHKVLLAPCLALSLLQAPCTQV